MPVLVCFVGAAAFAHCHFVKEKKFSWFYTQPDDDFVSRNMSL
jgi:hypothetical protein